ncbi:MAG: FRG domain-containing protein [Bryobacteraceae bacterium]
MKKKESRFDDENVQTCPDWATLTQKFDALPKSVWRRDEFGEVYHKGWIFRGHKRESYPLEPSIERAYPYCDWAEAEYKILREFQSKARMHVNPAQIPPTEYKLGWLPLMQHYGAPTRLLDFTYSPYVALYFALRNRVNNESDYAEIWAIDAAALREQAAITSREADQKSTEQKADSAEGHKVSFRLADAASALQQAQEEEASWDALIAHALDPCGTRRQLFNGNGFVAVAMPPLQNSRLSSQQGLFLFNGAEDSTFESSLEGMMANAEQQWYQRFRVPEKALEKIEEQLFQFNIHDLSLFPDIEGLAGFVRQKIRLHW